ncbi:MAG TPA: HEXXH motif-containing putative peptide modification protein [Pyrinomonadaceae bacterium]|nr:HEXXH motif-containing putative peptide modification protein [Pyrinomonadaceae bacterium]
MTRRAWEGIWDDLGSEQGYTGFSCPLEPFDESLAQMIAGEYARSVLSVFVERFAHVLSKNSLDELFSKLLNADLPLELAWSSELGNLYQATRLGDEDHALKTAAAFALMTGAKDFSDEWQLDLSKKFFSEERLQSFGSGKRRLFLLPRSAAIESGLFRDVDFADAALETFSPDLIETLTHALDLLKEHLPHYFDWVVRIIRRVAVLHFERNVLHSGNHEHQYGTIHISDNSRVLSLAEMLIHEASHQYFELLNKLGPTVDPGHTELYYSPVKQCDRPLHKILLAYHAFANVMLFYRGVAECGLADSSSAKFQSVLNDELRQLEQPLLDNDAILPIGRALVGPLIERRVCQ